jgi:hypothetical protein
MENSSEADYECPGCENIDTSSSESPRSAQEASTCVTFVVGEAFLTFKELQVRIKNYEQAKYMKFWKRDSRTVEGARKRVTRHLDEKIVYYEVTFCCINGGRKFKSSGEGIRSSL